MIAWTELIAYTVKADGYEATVSFHNGSWIWDAYLYDQRHGSPVIIRWQHGKGSNPVDCRLEAEAWIKQHQTPRPTT